MSEQKEKPTCEHGRTLCYICGNVAAGQAILRFITIGKTMSWTEEEIAWKPTTGLEESHAPSIHDLSFEDSADRIAREQQIEPGQSRLPQP